MAVVVAAATWTVLLAQEHSARVLAAPSAASAAHAGRGPSLAGSQGGADLLVTPTRVVFEGSRRTAAVTLVNTGRETATYRISFVQMQMTENGGIRELEEPEPGNQPADGLIRYSPRQVVLGPYETQTVRMQLRKPAELAPGEYRSHLLVRGLPPQHESVERVELPNQENVGFQVRLMPVYGVAIPVIVRHGPTSASVTLTDLRLRPMQNRTDPPVLSLMINRSGNQSVYGHIKMTFVPDSRTAHETIVGHVKGLAVYAPNSRRLVEVPLQVPRGLALRHGRLRVTYAEMDQHGKPIAESEVALP